MSTHMSTYVATQYLMMDDSGSIVPGSKTTKAIAVSKDGDATRFKSRERGTGKDNPRDPLKLTTLQQRHSVSLLFKGRSSFEAKFEVRGRKLRSGRNILFAGSSSLVAKKCGSPPPPPPPPHTPPPTQVPTRRICEGAAERVFETSRVMPTANGRGVWRRSRKSCLVETFPLLPFNLS